jgi:hypothetical protein
LPHCEQHDKEANLKQVVSEKYAEFSEDVTCLRYGTLAFFSGYVTEN